MVIVSAGITRHFARCRIGALGGVRDRHVVHGARHDDGLGGRHDAADVRANLRGTREITHVPGVAAVEPLPKKAQLGEGADGRNPAQIET
jgi:hypothetical protein